MLTLPTGQSIQEQDAPLIFKELLRRENPAVLLTVLNTVAKCESGSMKVSFQRAVEIELGAQRSLLLGAVGESRRAALEHIIRQLEIIHHRIVQVTSVIFTGNPSAKLLEVHLQDVRNPRQQ